MIPYIYILKISMYGMRNFNRLACNKYEARSVAVVISQYLIVRSEKKSKDTSSSQTLFSDVRNYSGWIAEPALAAVPNSNPDPDVCVAIQLATIYIAIHMHSHWHVKFHIAKYVAIMHDVKMLTLQLILIHACIAVANVWVICSIYHIPYS